MAASAVVVTTIKNENSNAVRQVLIDGLTERWGSYDPHLHPDIETFPQSLRDCTVLVASQLGQIVGTGTLKTVSARRAEVIRMSVAASCRRAGVGSLILDQLLDLARNKGVEESGVEEVVLETTSTWASAVAFYSRHGFHKTHERNDDSYFLYTLSDA